MKQKIKNLTGNDLVNCADLAADILNRITKDYSHVLEFVPPNVKVTIFNWNEALKNEIDRRQV